MLPLLLIALGAGALVLYMTSDHQKATEEANLAHQVTDAHQSAALQAGQQADQLVAQQQAAQQAGAKQEAARRAEVARQQAVAHAKAARTANTIAAQKVAEAAPLARTDRERAITALQADLTEANQAKMVAMEVMRRAAAIMESQPDAGRAMMASAQATYAAAQEKVRTVEAGLRKLGVSPLAIPAPPRRCSAR